MSDPTETSRRTMVQQINTDVGDRDRLVLTAVENDSAGRSKTIALGSFDLP